MTEVATDLLNCIVMNIWVKQFLEKKYSRATNWFYIVSWLDGGWSECEFPVDSKKSVEFKQTNN